jgi:hypothetical protein
MRSHCSLAVPDEGSSLVDQLWYRIRQLSLVDAVRVIRQFGDWQPDDASAALFTRLAAADAAAVAEAAEAPATTIPHRYTDHLAFAPDLSRLALLPTVPEPPTIEVYTLPEAHLVTRLEFAGDRSPWPRQVVYAGDSIVHMERREQGQRLWRVVRHRPPDWRREVLADAVEGHAVLLGALGDGFVVVAPDHFLFGSAEGPLRGPVRQPVLADGEAMLLATEPASGRMVVIIDDTVRLFVLDTGLNVLASMDLEHARNDAYAAWFCGPDTFVTFGTFKTIKSWRIVDGSLVKQGHTWLSKEDVQFGDFGVSLGFSPVPGQGRFAFARMSDPPLWYDARTLEMVGAPPAFGARFPVWVSPGDRYAVMGDRRELEVYDMRLLDIARLVATPLGQLTPADLAIDTEGLTGAVRSTVELLRACLAQRLA